MAKVKTIPPVFLSAGIPDPSRNPKYINTADIVAIREAVTALTLIVAPHGKLVFGGQPAISPLVFRAAKSIKSADKVAIYQSKFFKDKIPKESLAFENFKWTESRGDLASSLLTMRMKMLRSHKFGFGFFIGGMEGIEDEYRLFVEMNPTAAVFPIASTGAAANILFRRGVGPKDRKIRRLLKEELAYISLFHELLGL